MKTSFYFAVILSLLLSLTACEEEQVASAPQHDSYLVFGSFAGECMEECVHYYLLDMQERALYRISNKQYPYGNEPNLLQSDRYKLAEEEFQVAKHLFDELPEQIMQEANPTIGCPDCRDQGGLFLNFSRAGENYEFFVDTDKEAIPAYLQDFLSEAKNVLQEINKK